MDLILRRLRDQDLPGDLGLPYITTTAASMAAKAIKSIKEGVTTIRSINEYHKEKISELMLEDFE